MSLAVALALGGAPAVVGQTRTGVDWTDWLATGPSFVLGQVALGGGESANVTFSGPYYTAVTAEIFEPYWSPSGTYTGTQLRNPPPNRDLIVIDGGPETLTLSFSKPIVNPVLAITSLGLTNSTRSINIRSVMNFDQAFEVLSTGAGYAAAGQWTPFVDLGNSLYGTESSGVVRFNGTFTELSWTSPMREINEFGNLVGTYMFTLGSAGCDNFRLGNSALTSDSMVRAGCTAYTTGSFTQAAKLDVLGAVRAENAYTVNGQLNIANGARFDHFEALKVASGSRVELAGTLSGSDLQLAGQLESSTGSNWLPRGLVIDAGGQAVVGGAASMTGITTVNGLLRFSPSASALAGVIKLDASGAQLEVQGSLARSANVIVGNLFVNNGAAVNVGGNLEVANLQLSGSTLSVLPDGRLTNSQGGALSGSVANRGSFIQTAGELTAGAAFITNQGSWQVQGGTFNLGSGGVFNNLAGGRLEATGGTLALQGAGIVNLGTLAASHGGMLSVQGSGFSSSGRIEIGSRGTLQVVAGTLTSSGTIQVVGDFLNNAEVINDGTFNFGPDNLTNAFSNDGRLVNNGLLVLSSGTALGSYAVNRGQWHNNATLRVDAGATLSNEGNFFNNGQLIVTGFMNVSDGTFFQSAGGSLQVNGSFNTAGALRIIGGTVGGAGRIDGNLVLGAGATALPGRSPGTLEVTGNVLLEAGSNLELELSERGPHDQFRVGGTLLAEFGSTIALRLVDGLQPGVDQTFEVLRSDVSTSRFNIGGATIDGLPANHYLQSVVQASAGGGEALAWAITPDTARWVDAASLDRPSGRTTIFAEQIWFADTPLGEYSGSLHVEGTLGLRRDASLTVAAAQVLPGGRLLNSSSGLLVRGPLQVDGEFINRNQAQAGQVSVAAGGQFHNRGLFTLGHADTGSPELRNQGLLVHSGALWQNTTIGGAVPVIVNEAGGVMLLAGAMRGAVQMRNAGRLEVQAGAEVDDVQRFSQDAGSTLVDGRLAVGEGHIAGGVLGGRGVLQGPWLLQAAPSGGAPGEVVLRPGATDANGAWGGALTFADSVDILAGTTVEIMINGAGQNGRLAFMRDAVFDTGSGLRFVLADGWAPTVELSFGFVDTVPGFGAVGLVDVLGANSSVVVRGSNGDSYWAGGTWSWTERSDGFDLLLTPVPEPQTWALWLGGLAALTALSRRRAPLR